MSRLQYWTQWLFGLTLVALPLLASAAEDTKTDVDAKDALEGTGITGVAPIIGKSNSAVGSVPKIIENGFNITIAVAGIVFVVLLLIGGVMYLTSAGNDEQSKRAKTLLLDSVIGLVIVVTAWAVGNYVLTLLGISIGLS